jgi:hypothetical protein
MKSRIGAAALVLAAGSAGAMDLVVDGKPPAGIWYGAAPTNVVGPTDQKAAEELARVVKRMSGGDSTRTWTST